MTAAYAELHCLSDFSFQRGASSARELFDRAKACGYTALAITDECSLAGIVRALEASRETGVRLIVGTEVQLADGPKLVLLTETKAGTSLCRLITTGQRASEKGTYHMTRADFADGLPGTCVLWIPERVPSPSTPNGSAQPLDPGVGGWHLPCGGPPPVGFDRVAGWVGRQVPRLPVSVIGRNPGAGERWVGEQGGEGPLGMWAFLSFDHPL